MSLRTELARAFLERHPREAALALERMAAAERAAVVQAAPEQAAAALAAMVPAAAAETLATLAPADGAAAVEHLEADLAIALLRRMTRDAADRLLSELPERQRDPLRRVLRYPDGTAGAVMDPLALAFPADIDVAEARVRLRREPHNVLYYLYVVDRQGGLAGVLDIPELMRARARDSIESVMKTPVDHIPSWAPASSILAHPGWRSYHALPVTDEKERFAGAIRYQTLRRLEEEGEGAAMAAPVGVTVGALGELFHLGLAGMVEGVAGAATVRDPQSRGSGEKGER